MSELDCSSPESTVRSAADILSLRPVELCSRLTDSEDSIPYQDPPNALDSVVWFHATRIPRETTFDNGLLPTPEMLPRLLECLRVLAEKRGLCRGAEWGALVLKMESPLLSWKRSLSELDDGPHGFLVREVIVNRGKIPIDDYTVAPEYVSVLCEALRDSIGDTLLKAYKESSCRAIIRFRSSKHLLGVMKPALAYAHAKLHNLQLHENCNCGFSGRGVAIPSSDVLGIEWLDEPAV